MRNMADALQTPLCAVQVGWTRVPGRRAFAAAAANSRTSSICSPRLSPGGPQAPGLGFLPAITTPDDTGAKPLPVRKSDPIPNGRPLRGEHLGIGGMRNAPINEMGVVCLFALLATRPSDSRSSPCSQASPLRGSRRVGTAATASVRIEFEYESRKFRDHTAILPQRM